MPITDRLNKNKGFLNWETTLELAQQKFSEETDPFDMADRAGVVYQESDSVFEVPFLSEKHLVSYPKGEVYRPDGGEVAIANQILIIHYLTNAQGDPLANRLISFKELPSGAIYINPFSNRAIRPLVASFGDDPEKMVEAGMKLGGRRDRYGDASVTIPVFPRVMVTYILWKGDDEFPPSGNVLFDASAPYYLPTEDYAVLAGSLVFEMKKRVSQS